MAHSSFYPCFPQAAHTASKAPWHGMAWHGTLPVGTQEAAD